MAMHKFDKTAHGSMRPGHQGETQRKDSPSGDLAAQTPATGAPFAGLDGKSRAELERYISAIEDAEAHAAQIAEMRMAALDYLKVLVLTSKIIASRPSTAKTPPDR